MTVTLPQVLEIETKLISAGGSVPPCKVISAGQLITGAVWLLVHVTVLVVVAVLPQASLAVNVLVCEAEQEVVVIVPSVDVIVVVVQPSVAVAVPRAAEISEADGLQPSA